MPRSSQTIRVRKIGRKANQAREKKNVVPNVHRVESRTAQYYMFAYKIGNGRRSLTVRNSVYNYGPDKCPNSFNGSGRCEQGKKCHFSHSYLEILFHPLFYKTVVCEKKDKCTQGESCARAHSKDDFRGLRRVLGVNWRSRNPVGWQEKEDAATKKTSKRKPTRFRLGGFEAMSTTSESRSSLRASDWASRGASPSTTTTNVSMSTCSSPPMESERKEEEEEEAPLRQREEKNAPPEMNVTKREVGDEVSEFRWWFTNMFDDRGVLSEYLRRFEESGLDDIAFLWELCRDEREHLVDALVKVIGMSDEPMREVFEQTLCEYMNPLDVREWMDRSVGLPQYMDTFWMFPNVDTLVSMSLDDGALARMGVSSAGHRTKILFQLRKLKEKMANGR